MNIANILAEIFGGMLVLVGITASNRSYVIAVIDEMAGSKAVTWLTGFVTFVIGITCVAFYHAWNSDWTVAVTIIGWLMVLKGAFITLFPATSMTFYRRFLTDAVLIGAGIAAILIGLVLLCLGLTA